MALALKIAKFAHMDEVSIDLGDLTILVGSQGTGKSLALQWLKVALDGKHIVSALRYAGQNVDKPSALVDLIFGVGMGAAWRDGETQVSLHGKPIHPKNIAKLGTAKERVFFIPAHRAMLISDGWAAPFQKLTSETPAVARLFSQDLFDRFSARESNELFPVQRVLKKAYRDLINDAVFHGGTVGVHEDAQHSKRLRLTHGNSQLPFMTWTAGQREFTPLMLGLYHFLPPRRVRKRDTDYVVIEEPEMGIHPQAVVVVMLLVLDLLWRGYKVVLSTHSPLVLTVGWALRRLQETKARWQLLCDAFCVAHTGEMSKVATAALGKDVRTFVLSFGTNELVSSKDISSLDPESDDAEVSGWGGLAGFSSGFGEAVRQAVNEANGT